MQIYRVGLPMERIAIYVLGSLPESNRGNKYLLIAMDYFTKWPEAYPLPNQEVITVAKVLVEEMVCRFGVPLEIHSDQGRNFESLVFSEMCRILGIRKTRTTRYHPQSDGMVERFNRTMENQLPVFVKANQRDWDEHVPFLLMAYRTTSHESTGFSPTRLMMGHEVQRKHSQTSERHSEHVEISAPAILSDGGNEKGPELRRSKRSREHPKRLGL